MHHSPIKVRYKHSNGSPDLNHLDIKGIHCLFLLLGKKVKYILMSGLRDKQGCYFSV